MNHHPDFSSTDDEFEDYEYQEYVREQRYFSPPQLTEEQKKDQLLKNFQLLLMNGKLEEVISELNNGIDVNQKLQNEWTPIQIAASIANFNLVKELRNRGGDLQSNREGYTTLMLASNCPETTTPFDESAKVVQYLLNEGVNPNAINKKKINALMFASNNGNLKAVEILFPVTDLKAEDNQNWNALFWAVNGGKIDVVEYYVKLGLPYDKNDVRGNSAIDIARENDFDNIVELLSPEDNDDNIFIENYKIEFEKIFSDLGAREKPQFFGDVCKILYGTRCENLARLFDEKNIGLMDILSTTEENLEAIGVLMPFQRKRLVTGIHRFHKHPFHPKSIPTVGLKDLYSNMDVAAASLSAVKQFIVMEASIKYLLINMNNEFFCDGKRELEEPISKIQRKLRRLKSVLYDLSIKIPEWDSVIEDENVITEKSRKRWFPWRKTVLSVVIAIFVSANLWKKSFGFHMKIIK